VEEIRNLGKILEGKHVESGTLEDWKGVGKVT
jgi:hypothetical protein